MESKSKATRKKSEPNRDQVKPTFDPISRVDWLDDEVRSVLNGVGDPLTDQHTIKKRNTVLRVAYQIATGQSITEAFKQADTCDDTVWHGRWVKGKWKTGWKELPEIQTALAHCVAKLVPWLEAQKVKEIEDYRRAKALAISKHAAKSPDVLAEIQADPVMPPQYRIKAANDLMSWDAPEDAALINPQSPPGHFESVVNVVNDDRRTAEILDILRESGALEQVDDASSDAVHTSRPYDEASGVSAADLP